MLIFLRMTLNTMNQLQIITDHFFRWLPVAFGALWISLSNVEMASLDQTGIVSA